MKLVVAAAFSFISSTALAQPAHPGESVLDPAPEPSPPPDATAPRDQGPPEPVATPPSVTPPIVTISTMPVSTTIPGAWDDNPRTAAWIVTGAAGATLAAAVTWHLIYDRWTHVDKQLPGCTPDYSRGMGDSNNCFALNVPLTEKQQRKQGIYAGVDLGLGIATGATMLVAAYMWSRHYTPSHSVLVSPTTSGGTVSVGGAF